MGRSAIPSADPTTVWLKDLIEAMEAVAATAQPSHPAIVKAYSHRLKLRAGVRPPVRAGRHGYWRIRKGRALSNVRPRHV